jgi:phage terminase small subunit
MTRPLTAKQQRFVEEYLVDLNATQAAIRAGYSAKTAEQQGARLLVNVKVKAALSEAVQARSQRTEITQDRVLREIARLAFFDIRKLVNPDGTPRALHDLDDDTAAAISGLEVARVGNEMIGQGEVLKFKISDKNSALDKLAKHLQMFVERTELTGKGGGPLAVAQVTPEQLAEAVRRVRDQY